MQEPARNRKGQQMMMVMMCNDLVVVVVALSWVKAEPLYPHHNYILG